MCLEQNLIRMQRAPFRVNGSAGMCAESWALVAQGFQAQLSGQRTVRGSSLRVLSINSFTTADQQA